MWRRDGIAACMPPFFTTVTAQAGTYGFWDFKIFGTHTYKTYIPMCLGAVGPQHKSVHPAYQRNPLMNSQTQLYGANN